MTVMAVRVRPGRPRRAGQGRKRPEPANPPHGPRERAVEAGAAVETGRPITRLFTPPITDIVAEVT